ncbi:hypothetical protein UT300005_01000 [Clostridium sp. CTA-5]
MINNSSKKDKLLNKQFNKINKIEEKILTKKENGFIKNKLNPYKQKVEEKIPKKLQSTLESAFEKGFKIVFQKGTSIIEKSYKKEKIKNEFDIDNYGFDKQTTKKNLKKIDRKTNNKLILNKSISILEGGALGILGIGLPDIPLFIGVILKTIYEICLGYGYNYDTNQEKAYILNIICAAVTNGDTQKRYIEEIDLIGSEIDNGIVKQYCLDDLTEHCSKYMASSMLTSKFIQGLPLVGIVGGITNYKTIKDISNIAKIKYKKRYLNKIRNN